MCTSPMKRRRTPKRAILCCMFDGHNVFFDSDATYGKCWGMKEYLESTNTPLIVVAVDCNHSPNNGRLSEYSPFTFEDPKLGYIRGRGRTTMDWFAHTLKGMIDELSLKVDALGGGHVINSVEDAEIYYQETLRMLLDKNYLTGSDGGLDLTEDMARILTIVNRSGGFHTGMIYNYNDSNIPAAYRESLGWYITNGYLQGDETGELGLTEDMLRILKVFYDVLTAKKII